MEEWFELAGPKSDLHWKKGRSAMEAARCWLAVSSPKFPREVSRALATNRAFGKVTKWNAEPEARLPFDKLRGEPRNTDLLVHSRDAHGDFLIAVEAKADESFGETVADALANAVERRLANPRSRGVQRVEQLATALFGPRREGEVALGRLRYQLLTGVAGAVAAAARIGNHRVVFLVQEFRTADTTDEKHASNAQDLNAFLHRLSHGSDPKVESGRVYGPISLPQSDLWDTIPPLFVGKVSCELRQQSA